MTIFLIVYSYFIVHKKWQCEQLYNLEHLLYINNKHIHSNKVIMSNIIASEKEMFFLFTINYYKHYTIYGRKGSTFSKLDDTSDFLSHLGLKVKSEKFTNCYHLFMCLKKKKEKEISM